MTALRETRLGNPNAQERDGSFVAPVNDHNVGSAVYPVTILFSQLTVNSNQVGIPGLCIHHAGTGLIVNPASDAQTVIFVSVDETNYVKMTPGVRFECAQRFERLWVKASPSLPNTGQSFELDIFENKAVRLLAETPAKLSATAGSPSFAVTTTASVNTVTPSSNVCPFRASRNRAVIENQGPGDVYLGPASNVASGSGELLVAGASTVFNTTSDIYAFATQAATIVTAREEYS